MENTKFSFKQKVVVIKGFYKGFKGNISDFKKSSDGKEFIYKLTIETENKEIEIAERCLRGLYLGFI